MIKHPIARLLRPVRAGIGKIAWHHSAIAGAPELITVTSTAFAEGAAIPQRHAGAGVGANISPALYWSGVPAAAVELVLIVEDPDVPLPRPIVHGLFSGIAADCGGFPKGLSHWSIRRGRHFRSASVRSNGVDMPGLVRFPVMGRTATSFSSSHWMPRVGSAARRRSPRRSRPSMGMSSVAESSRALTNATEGRLLAPRPG